MKFYSSMITYAPGLDISVALTMRCAMCLRIGQRFVGNSTIAIVLDDNDFQFYYL